MIQRETRDEPANRGVLIILIEAKLLMGKWLIECSETRSHSVLCYWPWVTEVTANSFDIMASTITGGR